MPRAKLPVLPAALTALVLIADIWLLLNPVELQIPDVPPSRARPIAPFTGALAPPAPDPLIARLTLFSPSRSIDAATAGEAVTGVRVDPFAGGQLTGIVRARGYAVALFRDAGGHTVSVRAGDRIGDWRVAAVDGAGAVFARAGAVRRLAVGETAVVQPRAAQGGIGDQAR